MKSVQQLVDEALVPEPRIRSGKFSPSSFGQCYRRQFWNRKDEPQTNPADERALRVFHAGKLFHDFVQGCITRNGSKYDIEVKIETQPDIIGYADMVGEDEVVDIKSQHSKSFWYASKFKADDIKVQKYNNWLQVGYYARELGKKLMRLVFVSKDDLCINEYVQPLDSFWLGEIDKEITTLRSIWEKSTLPAAKPRLYIKQDKKTGETINGECEYCAWKDKCNLMENNK